MLGTIDVGWILLAVLAISVIFYSLGVKDGQAHGYMRGRAAGIKLGKMIKEQSRYVDEIDFEPFWKAAYQREKEAKTQPKETN